MLTVRPLNSTDGAGFAALMQANGCFCQFWEFTGDKNAWLERCALTPEANREDAMQQIAESRMLGIVAIENDAMLGFCRLAKEAPKVRRLPVYRALPDAQFEGALLLTCFYIREEARRAGVARALLEGAIAEAKRLGARRLIALPRVSPPMVHDEEGQFGPPSLFAAFREIHAGPHPVLELVL
jgi:GNAT superfamily N-acetyltransferase